MSNFNEKNPWIKERETILCGWKPDYNRGKFNNMNMNLAVDWYSFSNRQIRDYARMLKACGFTGVQITDDCSHWRWFMNYEVCHDKFLVLAKALRDEGMKVTMWVWAATFDGYGWVDHSVKYNPKDGGSSYDDPEVFATFNRYYDIYAELAPYVDRLIMHFYDPGQLNHMDDAIKFAKLLESKFKAKNPTVEIGIDTWAAPAEFPQKLIEAGFKDYTLMEINSWSRDKRRNFRQGVKDLNLRLGVWSWYLADMEIDQSAWMCVNARVEKDVYNRIRNEADDIMVPYYWAEMDSYHVMNMFSLYCAGHLLINPDDDPDKLVHDVAYKIYGDKYGAIVERALRLIQDGRSGDKWEDFWWSDPPRLKPFFNPPEIAKRAKEVLKELEIVAKDETITTDFPLPIAPNVLAELTLPHVEQIMHFAEFHIEYARIEKMAEEGAPKDVLFAEIDKAWEPVPDYNTIIGVWGQRETRAESRTVYEFCKKYGINFPHKSLYFYLAKKRYYEYMISDAKVANTDILPRNVYEGNLPYFPIQDEILRKLEEEGLIEILPDGNIKLKYFDSYKYK